MTRSRKRDHCTHHLILMGIRGGKNIRELLSKVIDMFEGGSETPALFTLSAHALEDYSGHFVCLSVYLPVSLSVSG